MPSCIYRIDRINAIFDQQNETVVPTQRLRTQQLRYINIHRYRFEEYELRNDFSYMLDVFPELCLILERRVNFRRLRKRREESRFRRRYTARKRRMRKLKRKRNRSNQRRDGRH